MIILLVIPICLLSLVYLINFSFFIQIEQLPPYAPLCSSMLDYQLG